MGSREKIGILRLTEEEKKFASGRSEMKQKKRK